MLTKAGPCIRCHGAISVFVGFRPGFGLRDSGFRVQGLGLRVWGVGFRVEGLGFRV